MNLACVSWCAAVGGRGWCCGGGGGGGGGLLAATTRAPPPGIQHTLAVRAFEDDTTADFSSATKRINSEVRVLTQARFMNIDECKAHLNPRQTATSAEKYAHV